VAVECNSCGRERTLVVFKTKQIWIGVAVGLVITVGFIVAIEYSLYDWGYKHRRQLWWLVFIPVLIVGKLLYSSTSKSDSTKQDEVTPK
jgi:hypothetical protein